jgi:phosphoserine aminotransferase
MGFLDAQELCEISVCTGNKCEVRKIMVLLAAAMKVAGITVIIVVIVRLTLLAEHE